ncbi:hypothetical protein GCM10009559_60750 [Pseudonocardia zijingensis]|uniref:Uncharacterized protein n=1 Tax=Pseudonocardia zijingensis TaxID=153376 RepID=A0ABP3YQY6_9PSEU
MGLAPVRAEQRVLKRGVVGGGRRAGAQVTPSCEGTFRSMSFGYLALTHPDAVRALAYHGRLAIFLRQSDGPVTATE